MAFFNKYPYTDFHELNLDWILERLKELVIRWSTVETEFDDLRDYVKNYFDSLDVKTEIDIKLEEMLEDGGLEDLLKNITTYTFGDTNLLTYKGRDASFGITNQWYRHYLDLGDLSATPILQGSCYNSNTGRVAICFGDTDHLYGRIVETSIDLQTVYRMSAVLNLGHCNGIAYIPETDRYIVAPANTGAYANRLIVVNPDTLTIESTSLSIIETIGTIAYDELNHVIYYANIYGTKIAIVTPELDTITTIDIDRFTEMVDCIGPGGSFCFKGTFYIMWANETTGQSYMSYYNLDTGAVEKYYVIPNNYYWTEAEGGFVANGNIYLLSSQFCLMMQELSGLPTVTDSRIECLHTSGKLISSGADLDDYITPGKYYCPNGATASLIQNFPSDVTPYGFSLYVIPIAADHAIQIMITNGQYENVYSRVTYDTIRNRNSRPSWRPWNVYMDKISVGDVIALSAFTDGATITGAGKEIYTYIPESRAATTGFINNATITGKFTIRQNGSYLLQNVDFSDSSIVNSVTLGNVAGKISLKIVLQNAPSGVVNNDVCSVHLDNLNIS